MKDHALPNRSTIGPRRYVSLKYRSYSPKSDGLHVPNTSNSVWSGFAISLATNRSHGWEDGRTCSDKKEAGTPVIALSTATGGAAQRHGDLDRLIQTAPTRENRSTARRAVADRRQDLDLSTQFDGSIKRGSGSHDRDEALQEVQAQDSAPPATDGIPYPRAQDKR